MKQTQTEEAMMRLLIPVALAGGWPLGFVAGPMLAAAGISMLGIYLTLVAVLLGCHLVMP